MASKSQDAEPVTTSGTVTSSSPFQRLRRRMAEMAVLDNSDRISTGEEISAILLAEDEAAMWDSDDFDKWNAQKLSGTDLQTTNFEVRFGDSSDDTDIVTPFTDDKGRQMYLLVHSFRITDKQEHKEFNLPPIGQEFTWNTSATRIVAKIFWMLDHGWFDSGAEPIRFSIQGTKLRGGRSVEKLKEFTGTPMVTAPVEITEQTPF